jgi:hypothetical protein
MLVSTCNHNKITPYKKNSTQPQNGFSSTYDNKKKRGKLRVIWRSSVDSVFILNVYQNINAVLWLFGDSHIFLISTSSEYHVERERL